MSRHDSEDVLGSLLAEGMPDRAAAANLENVPEGEVGFGCFLWRCSWMW